MSHARMLKNDKSYNELEKNIPQGAIKEIFTKNLSENLAMGIPTWFFNFWWRFINLVDSETDSSDLGIALREQSYKIAFPLMVGTSALSLLMNALRSEDIRTSMRERKYCEAITNIFFHMAKELKNPDCIFEALYSFSTCLGWTCGYALFTQICRQYSSSFLFRMCVNAAGAVAGNFAGALAMGAIWGAGSLAFQSYCKSDPTLNAEERLSTSMRCWKYVASCIKDLPGSAAWSIASDIDLVAMMLTNPRAAANPIYKYLIYILDSTFVATSSSMAGITQMLLEKGFCPIKSVSPIVTQIEERKPLLNNKTISCYGAVDCEVKEEITIEISKVVTIDEPVLIPKKSAYLLGQTLFEKQNKELTLQNKQQTESKKLQI